jgi:hypothetical protein
MTELVIGALISVGALLGLVWDWWRHPDAVRERRGR